MFKGSNVALITPFKNNKLDQEAYVKLINFHLENNTNGLVPAGTTGESPTLSHKEHEKVIELCIKEVKGKIPVIAGTGSNSTDEAVELSKFAEKAGSDALLVVTPYYNKPTQEGLYQHYKSINDNSSIIIDVRTPEEFSKGHLRNALNINWFDDNFEDQVEILSRDRPVFIYCLSGGRSAKALDKISKMGFKNSYELDGGILEWRKNNYPESKIKVDLEKSLSVNEFSELITSDKIVMVDYFAKWCAPCKVMEPFLDDLSEEYRDNLELIRIDYDQNLPLVKSLGVQGLPVIQLYYNNQLLWSKDGFSDKITIEAQIKKYL